MITNPASSMASVQQTSEFSTISYYKVDENKSYLESGVASLTIRISMLPHIPMRG